MRQCIMKGFLSFLILWMIRTRHMTGAEIADELEKRKGHRPSPGTIYPALKELKKKGLVKADSEKRYSLTDAGEAELERSMLSFFDTFWDIDEMRECCCKWHGHGEQYHRRHHHAYNDACED